MDSSVRQGFTVFSGISVDGISAYVPDRVEDNCHFSDRFGEKFCRRFGAATGIKRRHLADGETTLDMCVEAAQKLIANEHSVRSVDALIMVTQTPDYKLPASACIAQHRLELGTHCAAFDVSLGCSGYVYGLWLASSLISSGAAESVLLLAGDTISKLTDPLHKSTSPIFGDAGSATLIKRDLESGSWAFVMGTDGEGYRSIIAPGSSMRPYSYDSEDLTGEFSDSRLHMDGAAVFEFATCKVPELITRLIQLSDLSVDQISKLYLHQANELILKSISRKTGIALEKTSINLDRFGNTSSASIPLAIATDRPGSNDRSLLCGFGVGLSWGAMTGELGELRTYVN